MKRTKTSAYGWGIATMIAAASTTLFLMQCGDSNLGTPTGDAAAGCPTNPPQAGTACSLPSGTMCNNYPQPGCECCAGGGGYECTNGKWEPLAVANGVAPAQVCPQTAPEAGSPCQISSPCGGALQSCSYDCETGNGAAVDAVCTSGAWQLEQLGIACELDAGLDAGDAD